jgi:hypothetical protein
MQLEAISKMYLNYNGCETPPRWPEFISDLIDYRVDKNQGSGYFFSRPDEHGGGAKWQRESAAWIGKSGCVFLGDTEGCFRQAAKSKAVAVS